MAFPTKFIDGTAITFKMGSTQYEAEVGEFNEITTEVGGETLVMADGSIYTTPKRTMVTAIRITVVQGISASTALFRYLRETASGAATVIATGSSSNTPSSSNPKWTYSVTGWTRPAITFRPGGVEMVECIMTVSGNPTEGVV